MNLQELFLEAVATCFTALSTQNNGEVTLEALSTEMQSNYPQLNSSTESLTQVLNGKEIRSHVPNIVSVTKGDVPVYFVRTKTGIATASSTIQPKASNSTVKIARTKIVQEMQQSKGRFMTVSWLRKDGTEAVYNGRVLKDKFMDTLGYILLRPANPNQQFRKVDPNTIQWVSLNGVNFYPR